MSNRITTERIMIVDDESDITVFCKISLEYYGYEVDTFNEPKKALSKFKPNYYDLVILDIKMPEMNGFELHKRIRDRSQRQGLFSYLQVNSTIRSLEQKSIGH